MTNTAETKRLISLRHGATVSIEEYGVPDGIPVFFIHGWPGSAAQGRALHAAALGLNVRIISMDRPGIGASSPQADRQLLDWPPLLHELAAALGLERYRVLGVSGGGPYALASAWGLPDEIDAVAVVCGAPPLAEIGSAQGFNFTYRLMLAIHRYTPGVIRGLFRIFHPLARIDPPAWMMVAMRGVLVGPDKVALSNREVAATCHDGFRGAWGAHRDGVFEDALIYIRPWGFRMEEIRVPVRVWHGTEDANFSHTLTEYARRIPGVELRILPDEGHYSLPFLRTAEILADLIAIPARTPALAD